MPYHKTRGAIVLVLSDGKPHSARDILVEARKLGITKKAAYEALFRCWKSGVVLRTPNPIFQRERVYKRALAVKVEHTRSFHLYVLNVSRISEAEIGGQKFVGYSKEFLDARGGGAAQNNGGSARLSKARMIMGYIASAGRPLFAAEISNALKEKGVKPYDVSNTFRRYEKKGRLYVRGYHTDGGNRPFAQGFLVSLIDHEKEDRELALDGAIEACNKRVDEAMEALPFVQKIKRFRDIVHESMRLGELVSLSFVRDELHCTQDQAEHVVKRGMQLHSTEIKEIPVFGRRYFYHSKMDPKDFAAALKMKQDYVRKSERRVNRVGHNFEACAEWMVEKFSPPGTKFMTQNHRLKMDPKRITIHLVRPVRGRRNNAELDRVWTVKTNSLTRPITYILECKSKMVTKDDLDSFLDVLKASQDFGCDTESGRQIKQGIVPVFAAQTFNPKQLVQIPNDGSSISLAAYCARLNIEILKASDFNKRLVEKGVDKFVSIQKICRAARNEDQVRSMLDAVWEMPAGARSVLSEAMQQNSDVFAREKEMEAEEKGDEEEAGAAAKVEVEEAPPVVIAAAPAIVQP